MGHQCSAILANGLQCRQQVADLRRPDCGRHGPVFVSGTLPHAINPAKCAMHEPEPGVWMCLIHGDSAWDTARALGASAPCRVPIPADTRLRLARTKNLAFSTANLLSRDQNIAVRETLAGGNPVPRISEHLASDQNSRVRMAAAANPLIPRGSLARLAKDTTPMVRRIVARNKSADAALLALLCQDPDIEVVGVVAGNERTPERLLRQLATHANSLVRERVATNGCTPIDLLLELERDDSISVRISAKRNLARREARERSAGPALRQVK